MAENILNNKEQPLPNVNANTASTSPFIFSIPTNPDMSSTNSHSESKDAQ